MTATSPNNDVVVRFLCRQRHGFCLLTFVHRILTLLIRGIKDVIEKLSDSDVHCRNIN